MAELKDRSRVEGSFARKLSRLSARHRRELTELLGDPADYENVPESFWDQVEEEVAAELIVILMLIFAAGAMQHGLDKSRANILGERWATRRAKKLSRDFTRHSRERVRVLTRNLSRERESAEESGGTPPRGLKSRLRDGIRGVFGPERSERIAITETTDASTSGAEAGVKETDGLSEDDTWYTEEDARVCDICAPLHRKPRSVWSRKFPDGSPAHPGCRCWIEYTKEKVPG